MTADELFALPDDDRTDRRLIRGRLVERAYPFRCPAHAAVVANLCGALGNWKHTSGGRGWRVYGYGCPYRLGRDPDTVLYYDATVVSEQIEGASPASAAYLDGRPELAVEVIDLSDPPDAVMEVLNVSLAMGVACVWLIDPFAGTVTVYRPSFPTVVLAAGDELIAPNRLEGLGGSVADLLP